MTLETDLKRTSCFTCARWDWDELDISSVSEKKRACAVECVGGRVNKFLSNRVSFPNVNLLFGD